MLSLGQDWGFKQLDDVIVAIAMEATESDLCSYWQQRPSLPFGLLLVATAADSLVIGSTQRHQRGLVTILNLQGLTVRQVIG